MAKFIIGVDEAGRGPIAGPVAVGVVLVPAFMDIAELFPGVGDSKKLTTKKREELYALLVTFAKQGVLRFEVVFAGAHTIDTKGISYAVRTSLSKGVRSLAPDPENHYVLLDGLLHAPEEYAQKTIIGGDATEPVISLASIAAKVTRDRLLCRLAKQYPQWGFETHKGYGTSGHYAAIRKHGLSPIHRRSYGLEE